MDFLHVLLHQAAHHVGKEIEKKAGCSTIILFAIGGLIAYIVF